MPRKLGPKHMLLSCKHIIKVPRGKSGDEIRARVAAGEVVKVDCPWHGPRLIRELLP